MHITFYNPYMNAKNLNDYQHVLHRANVEPVCHNIGHLNTPFAAIFTHLLSFLHSTCYGMIFKEPACKQNRANQTE